MNEPPVCTRLTWAGIDLDGVLAEEVWTPGNPTRRIGAPIQRNVNKVLALVRAGWRIVIHTSRPWADYELIETWLLDNGVPFDRIVAGKVLCGIYVDNRAVHESEDCWSTVTHKHV